MPKENRVGREIEVLCAQCRRKTRHTVRGSWDTFFADEEREITEGATHDLVTCNGCRHVTYRVESWCSEGEGTCITLYPPRAEDTAEETCHRPPKDFNLAWDSPLLSVYHQTLAAYRNDLMTLAGAGVRLLIEGICNEQGVTEGPILDKATGSPIKTKTGNPVIQKKLEGKINGMVERHLITKKQAAHLHEIRSLGNDAAHELDRPSRRVISDAIDIIEHIFNQVYELPLKAKAIQTRTRPTK